MTWDNKIYTQHLLSVEEGFSHLKEEHLGSKIQQVVMPIFQMEANKVTPLGTGFIISPDGLMMTARHLFEHVVEGPIEGNQHYEIVDKQFYALYSTNDKHPDGKNYIGGPWPITRIWTNNTTDIALCQLQPAELNGTLKKFDPVKLSFKLPAIGGKVLAFGYYKSEAKFTQENVIEMSQNTAFSTGKIVDIHPVKRDSSRLNFPCFHFDAKSHPGLSGSPIFGEDGSVCGVLCEAIEEEPDSKNDPVTYGSLLWPSIGIQIQAKFSETEPERDIRLYELVKRKNIRPNEEIDDFLSFGKDSLGKDCINLKFSI